LFLDYLLKDTLDDSLSVAEHLYLQAATLSWIVPPAPHVFVEETDVKLWRWFAWPYGRWI